MQQQQLARSQTEKEYDAHCIEHKLCHSVISQPVINAYIQMLCFLVCVRVFDVTDRFADLSRLHNTSGPYIHIFIIVVFIAVVLYLLILTIGLFSKILVVSFVVGALSHFQSLSEA